MVLPQGVPMGGAGLAILVVGEIEGERVGAASRAKEVLAKKKQKEKRGSNIKKIFFTTG